MAQPGSKTFIAPSSKQTSETTESQATKTEQTNSPTTRDKTHSNKNLSRRSRFLTVENFIIIWLDFNIHQSNQDNQNSIAQLRRIVNSIQTFTDSDRCIDYLTDVQNEKVVLIVSGSFGQQVVHLIYEITQLVSIYVFCGDKVEHSQWASNYKKVKGVFTQIEALYHELKMDVRLSENALTPISVIPKSSTTDLDELDPSFMYSQLLKEILLDDDYFDPKQKQELIDFCRVQYADNDNGLKIIDEFERNYPRESPIWWYTRDCFVYPMLNKALRTQDIEVIIKMGFFVRDLHEHIEQLHSQREHRQELIVFRGQGLFQPEFDKISNSKGGLLAFNNFLSTSTDRLVSLLYAESTREDHDLIAVLFQIKIDPSTVTTPFASLDKVSFFSDQEKEVLFSMHTVFRIGETTQIEPRLFQIDLASTSDNDPQLQQVTEHMREMTLEPPGLDRMASLMSAMGEFDKAEDIYMTLLDMTSDEERQYLAHLHHQLGAVFQHKGDLSSALSHYQQSLDIDLTYLSPESPWLSPTYSNIGSVLRDQGDLDGALKYHERALRIDLHTSEPDQLSIANHQNNIGAVFTDQGKYDEALKSYEHVLEIVLVHLPPRHPDLAFAYNNIGKVHHEMSDNLSALLYYQKALEIRQRSLPPHHPLLADTHHNMSFVLDNLHRTKEAIEHAERAVDIVRRSLGSHHPRVQKDQQYLDELRRKV
jgi:tetratricopeptide (TPR) repeat protein